MKTGLITLILVLTLSVPVAAQAATASCPFQSYLIGDATNVGHGKDLKGVKFTHVPPGDYALSFHGPAADISVVELCGKHIGVSLGDLPWWVWLPGGLLVVAVIALAGNLIDQRKKAGSFAQ